MIWLGQGGLLKRPIIVTNNNLIPEFDANTVDVEDETHELKIKETEFKIKEKLSSTFGIYPRTDNILIQIGINKITEFKNK